MTLNAKQHEFAMAVAHFLIYLDAKGYEVSFGEAHRPEWVAEHYSVNNMGIRRSLHIDRLALDLNIFWRGTYLQSVDELKGIGEYWESMSNPSLKLCWGGHFKTPDVLHFSAEHNGVR